MAGLDFRMFGCALSIILKTSNYMTMLDDWNQLEFSCRREESMAEQRSRAAAPRSSGAEQSRCAAEQQSGRSSGAAGQRSSGAEDVSGSV